METTFLLPKNTNILVLFYGIRDQVGILSRNWYVTTKDAYYNNDDLRSVQGFYVYDAKPSIRVRLPDGWIVTLQSLYIESHTLQEVDIA